MHNVCVQWYLCVHNDVHLNVSVEVGVLTAILEGLVCPELFMLFL